MPNTHLTSKQIVHEDVNSMVAYNDTVIRTKKKRIFFVFLIPCLLIALLAVVIFGFRDVLFVRLGLTSSTAAIEKNEGEDVKFFLASDEELIIPDDSEDNDFGIPYLSINIPASESVYNGFDIDWSKYITNIPSDAEIIDSSVIDVDATMAENKLESLTLDELKAYLAEDVRTIEIVYVNSNKAIVPVKEAGRYFITAVLDDKKIDKALGDNIFDPSYEIVDNYRAAILCAEDYITIKKSNLNYINVNSVIDEIETIYNREDKSSVFKINGLPQINNVDDPTIAIEYTITDAATGEVVKPINAGSYVLEEIKLTSRNYEEKVISFKTRKTTLLISPMCIDDLIVFEDLICKFDNEKHKLQADIKDPIVKKAVELKYYINGKLATDKDLTVLDATTSDVVVTLKVNNKDHENYYTSKVFTAKIRVTKADFRDLVSLPEKTSSYRQVGKVFYPQYVQISKLPENATVTPLIMYDEDGKGTADDKYEKVVTKVSKLGDYRITYEFRDKNYYDYDMVIDYSVKFNPFLFIFVPFIGLILNLLILWITILCKRRKDKKSRQHFISLRVQLERERGGVVCESYAKSRNKFYKKKGRLYLTAKALEFYDDKYLSNHRNSVVLARDITDIKAKGIFGGKLIILSRGGVQKIKVPAGTAKIWKKEILQFKHMEQCYYSEVHAINPDETRSI